MISVCLAAFNGERHIGRQIESILESSRVGELLVSDDGSTDSTREIVQGMGDPRVRLMTGPGKGLIRNFEFLLRQARGEHIFLSDQDDVWLPTKVDVMMDALQRADLAVSDCRVVDEALHELHPSFFRLRGSGPGLWRNLLRNSYVGCCMALHRRLLPHVLPFPAAVPVHDWWIGLVAELRGTVAFVDMPLILYRRHGRNASSTAEPSQASTARRLAWRVALARSLWSRRAIDTR